MLARLLFPALLAGACGCAAHAPADLAARSMADVPASFASASPAHAGDVEADWLASFRAPTLVRLVADAMQNNPDLGVAAARWEEAVHRTRVARSYLLPSLQGRAGAEHADAGAAVGSADAHNIGATASWEIDLWGRLRAGLRASRDAADAAAHDYRMARLSLAAAVADSWFLAIAARGRLAIDHDLLEAEQRTASVVRDKVETGIGTQLEAELAEANLKVASAAVARDQAAEQELVKALEALLGRYPASELAVASDLPPVPPTPGAGVPSELLHRRPDIVAADRRVAEAFHLRESARAARLPQVTLTASIGTLLEPTSAIWSLGANLLAPVFTGGRLEAEERIAGAREQQALAAYVGVAIGAFREVETSLANEQLLTRRQAELEQAAGRMRNASRIAVDRYEAGIHSIVELMVVRRQDFDVRAQLLAVRTDRLRQRVALHRALGGGFDDQTTTVAAAAPRRGIDTR